MFKRIRISRAPWEDVTGDQEVDLVIAALRGIELHEGEHRGWDLPARLYTLHRLHPDVEALEARLIPSRIWDDRGHPVDGLQAYAIRVARFVSDQMAGPPAKYRRLSFSDTPDGIAAVCLINEGWKAPTEKITAGERRRQAAGQRVLHNSPHRIEVRIVAACDINGNTFYVERENGEPATRVRAQSITGQRLDPHEPGAPNQEFGGLAVDCLFTLALAARTGIWPRRGPASPPNRHRPA